MIAQLTDLFTVLREVKGHLTWGEGFALHNIARDRVVLEFGTYLGRSALCMALSARRVVTVDHNRGDEYLGATQPDEIRRTLVQNAGRFPRAARVLEFYSLNYRDFKVGEGFDVGFFDADHSYDSTVFGMRAMAKIPILCVHDYLNFAEVKKAVDDERGNRDLALFDSLAVLTRKEEA